MHKKPVKFTAKYGMAIHPKAFRPHLLDTRRSAVRIFPDRPELTDYDILWQCGKSAKKPIAFLSTLPVGVELCRACQLVRDRLEFYDAEVAAAFGGGPAPF